MPLTGRPAAHRSFVSDQFHESLPFRFAPGYENRRVNLTLLFGDRWSGRLVGEDESPRCAALEDGQVGGSSCSQHTAATEGWDVFG